MVVFTNVHCPDRAEYTSDLDDIADVERSIKKDHHAGGKVAQRVLQGKADNETCDTKAGQQWGDRYSHLPQCDQKTDEQDDILDRCDGDVAQELAICSAFEASKLFMTSFFARLASLLKTTMIRTKMRRFRNSWGIRSPAHPANLAAPVAD